MDCNPPGSSVHGISQAKKLDWVAMLSSRGSSWPRDRTHVSCSSWTAGAFFTAEPPGSLSTQKMLVIIFGRIRKLAFFVFNTNTIVFNCIQFKYQISTYLVFYLFMAVLGLHYCAGFLLVATSGGYSLLLRLLSQWHLLLQSMGSMCAGFSSCSSWAQQSWCMGLVSCEIFPDQWWKLSPSWRVDSLRWPTREAPHWV